MLHNQAGRLYDKYLSMDVGKIFRHFRKICPFSGRTNLLDCSTFKHYL